jgi:hypothetical protein
MVVAAFFLSFADKHASAGWAKRVEEIETDLDGHADQLEKISATVGPLIAAKSGSPALKAAEGDLAAAAQAAASPGGTGDGSLLAKVAGAAVGAMAMACLIGCASVETTIAEDAGVAVVSSLARDGTVSAVQAEPASGLVLASVANDLAGASTNGLPTAASLNSSLGLDTVANLNGEAAKLVAQLDSAYSTIYSKVNGSPAGKAILSAALAGIANGINQGLGR